MDDSTKSSPAKTVKFGADAAEAKKKVEVTEPASTKTAREFATRGVVERHGEAIRNNPNFEKMVDDEMNQIEANRKATETM